MADSVTCPICGYRAKTPQGLLLHRRWNHGIEREGIERSDLVERLEGIEDVLKTLEMRLARIEEKLP